MASRINTYYNLTERDEKEALWNEMNQIERTAVNRLIIMDDYRKGIAALEASGSGFFSINALKQKLDAEDEFYSKLIDALNRGITQLVDM